MQLYLYPSILLGSIDNDARPCVCMDIKDYVNFSQEQRLHVERKEEREND